jgi:hypothetical protein
MTTTDEAPPVPAPAGPAGTPQYNAALAAAQAEMPPITKGGKAEMAGLNKDGKPYHKEYKYADLGAICVVASPILGKHGLAFTSKPTLAKDGKFVLQYKLLHSSGEFDGGEMLLPSSTKPQDLGSLLTYYKRYAFCCITGITPVGEDDDAQSSNNMQNFERYPSAGEAFENATPAPPRNQRQDQPQARPAAAVTVPPLAPEDPWADKIAGVTGKEDGTAVRAEIAHLLESGQIDQDRASRLNAVLTAKGISLQQAASAAAAVPDAQTAAAPPPPIRQEDQGARKPQQAPGNDDSEWVTEFLGRLAETGEDGLSAMQREVGAAVGKRTIKTDTAAELSAAIRGRRNDLQSVPA